LNVLNYTASTDKEDIADTDTDTYTLLENMNSRIVIMMKYS
jgi:hypothetical protein